MTNQYDLIVIGGGSGGVRAARMSARYGARVALVEEHRLGGTCVIRGCVPKKLFAYASRFSALFDVAPSFGWKVDAEFDWPTLKANKDKEIARLEAAYEALLEDAGVTVFADRATLTGPESVRLANASTELTANRILIATGGHPAVPEIEGAELAITSNEAFELEKLPSSILIVGGGYVAAEFASIFNGLGVDVTLSYRRDLILRGFDRDLREEASERMQACGISISTNSEVKSLSRGDGGIVVEFEHGPSSTFESVMFATGRVPNTAGLGLDEVGVMRNARAAVEVDEWSQSSVQSVFAVGDVTGRAQLTPVAIREGAAFAETEYNGNPTAVDHRIIPTAVFCEPEIGSVGLSEDDAVAHHEEIEVYLTRFTSMFTSMSDKPSKVLFKMIAESGTRRVLGVHILGRDAAEMVQLAAIPVSMGATKADFDRTFALHPTAAEELVTLREPSYRVVGGKRV